jgi:hypothetical protein
MKPGWWLDRYAAMLRAPQRCNPKAGAASQMCPRDRGRHAITSAMEQREERQRDESAHERA